MGVRLVDDPAAEARTRIGRGWEGRGVDPEVLADAERQVTGMLAGLNDLVEAFPMLGEPIDRTGETGERAATTSQHRPPERGGPGSAESRHTEGGGELHELSLTALAERLRTREVSPVEVTRAMLDRIERNDGTLRTFIRVTAEKALDQARRAEDEITRGVYRGSLHGVPLAAKDLYDVAGVPTTAGSSILHDWTPSEDSAA
ncbi:MAG TPA: amidase family protein, partial [Chloroflexota bacterium]|nr:amidase family protein [Chloroflexota bacterium]